MITHKSKLAALLSTAATLALSHGAHASGTVAGTTISNTATVGYSVGTTAQTPVTSNTATFLVDRKVNLTVTQVGGAATSVALGSTAQVTTFSVTNLTNATQDFRLVGSQQTSLTATVYGGVDNFDVNNLKVYVDANGDGIYEPGIDTQAYIDELAPDTSKTVFIVADIPTSTPASGDAGVALTAVTAAGGTAGTLGADVTATVGADSPTTVDTVFADGAGVLDLIHDGMQSAFSQFNVSTAAITFTKTATLISDPIDGIVLPKAIPGAVVEYCLRVANAGPATATSVTMTDTVPANTTYVANSLYVGGTVLAGVCLSDGVAGGTSDGTTVTATVPTILPTTTVTARFRVTLN